LALNLPPTLIPDICHCKKQHNKKNKTHVPRTIRPKKKLKQKEKYQSPLNFVIAWQAEVSWKSLGIVKIFRASYYFTTD
jgi:hypothetical protein